MVKLKKLAFRTGLLTLLFSLPFCLSAQQSNPKLSERIQNLLSSSQSQEAVAAFVYFKDKGDHIDEKLTVAKNALTPAALQRRITNRGEENVVDISDIPVNPVYLNAVKSEVSKIRHQLKGLNAVSVEATPVALEFISTLDFVKKVTLVKKIRRTPDPVVTPSQLKSDQQSMLLQPEGMLTLDYGGSYTQNNQINVPAVHDLGYDGTGVVIAIFDSGFNRLTHEAFNQMDIADTWDFVNGDADVGDGSDMGTGSHGTNTLSTVGGYAPGDLIGPAYGATYYLAKTENTESELHVEEDNWCAAAEWADTNGAQIITSSLGYTVFDTGTDYTWQDMDGDTTIVTQCADLAATKGIVVINSAGNNGYHSTNNTLGAPSDGHFVIAAGAVTSSGSRSSFSSVGLSADGRIKPDVMAMGSGVRVASATSNTGYSSVNGTSFSCPLTAGVAALVIESNPSLTAAQVRDILRNTADNAASPNRLYGYGILNALAAVEEATANILNASFTFTTNLLEVTFSDTSSAPTGESITGWSWNFGDGTASSVQNPVHTFSTAGNYSVTLTVTDSAGSTDSITNSVTVTDALDYCTSRGNNNFYEWIARVDVGAFSNSSGAAGYSDFTSMLINLALGNSYATTLFPGFGSSGYTEYWKVWIDFNKNGSFVDPGEEVFSGSGRSAVTGNITIPTGVSTGDTRMRVSMKYGGTPTPCEIFTYGEVEDYTVRIGN